MPEKRDQRHGSWMATASGRQFWPLDPRPEEVNILDIAHALARLCRFGGHVACLHYSVAQHSVLVSEIVEQDLAASRLAFAGLLHDAAEAYVQDIVQPVKRALRDYAAVEASVARAIGAAFGVDPAAFEHELVKHADLIACSTEKRDVMSRSSSQLWPDLEAVEPRAAVIEPWPTLLAEARFLERFTVLSRARRSGP